GNATIVLHMTGSHGPSYYRRYPAEFAKFKPECRTSEFSDCTTDEIVNAYDNSILYTDHILSEIINVLKGSDDRFAPAMIYMSDHGESLGEDGLYLHAAPYFIAPDVQTHIPFIAWFSPDYANATKLATACVRQDATDASSHANLFDGHRHDGRESIGLRSGARPVRRLPESQCRGVELGCKISHGNWRFCQPDQ